MLAGASLQHDYHRGECSPLHSSPGLVGKDGGVVQRASGAGSSTMGGTDWSNALAVGRESAVLPRDPATCVLWCAIALGALVRGPPLEHVRRYVELAEDSLLVCFDGDVSTARAYVAMALLYNFLGDQVKVDEYTKLTKNRVELVPPEEIPRGFRDVLQYAGFAKVIETKMVPAKDVKDYWENLPPLRQLSEKVMERDICGLVLSVNMWINKPFSEVALADRMLGTLEQQPSKVASVATHPPMENLDMFNAKAYHYCPDSVEACEEVKKKSVLHELLRVKEGIEKSGMHAGIGGILYYGSLAYLQLLHRLPGARISCEKMLRVFLRYPGLCRFNHWWVE